MSTLQKYPLYDELAAAAAKSTSVIDIRGLVAAIMSIQNLPPKQAQEHYEEITALIYHNELCQYKTTLTSVPYNGRVMTGGRGILYSITSLPPGCQRILAEYIRRYTQQA